jgi:hypothetical protein
MNKHILIFKKWYEQRTTREKIWILTFNWALLYAIFYFSFFRSLDAESLSLSIDIKKAQDQIKSWDIQISALKKIAESPLYQQWLNQKQKLESLEKKYHVLLKTNSSYKGQDILKDMLNIKSNTINLIQAVDFPETDYEFSKNPEGSHMYQKKFRIVIDSNFFDAVNYMQELERFKSNIQWSSLDYHVVQYPIAKIEMEFSIFYEKNI